MGSRGSGSNKSSSGGYKNVEDDSMLYDGRADLTDEQREYLLRYSVMSGTVNSYLRMPEKLSSLEPLDDIKNGIPAIDKAISSSNLKENIKVYRVMDASYLPKNLSVGDVFTDKAYTSTSIHKSAVDKLEKTWNKKTPARLEINVPKGKNRGIYMQDIAAGKDQYEFLLKRNASYKVTKISNGVITVTMM